MASSVPKGYHRLADLMSRYSEAAVFRRFGALNMLNLLSLQAELIDLQDQFHDMWAEDDDSSDPNEKQFSTYFRLLRGAEDSFQYEKLNEIRKKLHEYNAAVMQVSEMQKLPAPEQNNLGFLREWLRGKDEGDNFLRGNEMYTWQLPDDRPLHEHRELERDLMTIHQGVTEQDPLSKKLSSSLLNVWNWAKSQSSPTDAGPQHLGHQGLQKTIDPDSGVLHYSEERLLRFNNILISVISAIMPIISIVALYFINSVGGRIGAMAGFTTVFALVLATCTNARRLEIAASTAAFAAVEVVFIGSDLGTS